MALRFVDSFDHMLNTDLQYKYNGGITGVPTITTGRLGSALQCTDANTQQSATRYLGSEATWIIGFAFLFNSPISANNKPMFYLLDGATNHLSVDMLTGHSILQFSGAWGAVYSPPIRPSRWYYLEMKITIADSPSGSYEFRLDGVTFASASGVDTRNGGNASADRIQFRAGGSGGTSTARRFDDLYVCDGNGSSPTNDFLGDCRVEAVLPNGNGNSSGFTGSDGNSTDNYLLMDEATPNTSDYVEGAPTTEDTYTMGDVATTTGTVYGVQPVPFAFRNDTAPDASPSWLYSVARLSGTEEDSAAKGPSIGSYLYLTDIRETKPGGGAWSISDVNSAEFGVKVA